MRRLAPGFVLAAILAGCSAHDAGSQATDNPPAPSGTVAANPVSAMRSPVPAFHGGGVDWRIDLQAESGLRHTARLLHSGDWTNATLALRSATPASAPSTFVFEGTLFAAQGDTPLRLEIVRVDCKDDAGTTRMQTVVVTVRGAAPLHGCGEITPY